MCDELGDNQMMQDYVESMGATSLCSVETLKGCNDKSKTFIGKWKEKSSADIAKELGRVEGMISKDSGSVKPEMLQWQKARAKILKALAGSSGKGEEL